MTNTPKNTIKPAWRNLFLRAQSATRSHDGIAFMQLLVVCKDGNPLFWAEPKVVKIEPKLHVNIDMLREHMDDKELLDLLQYIIKTS